MKPEPLILSDMRSGRHAAAPLPAGLLELRPSQSWQSSRFTGLFLTDGAQTKTPDNCLMFLPVSG